MNTSRHTQLIVLLLVFILVGSLLSAKFNGNVQLSMTYSDNAFQLSQFDLQRNENGHPDMQFVESADDIIFDTRINGFYDTAWRWWQIQPSMQINASENLLNTDKSKADFIAGVSVKRMFGDLGLYYGYSPDNYIRHYKDSDGTGMQDKYSFAKNLYKAALNIRPVNKSTVSLEYRLEEYFYNKYFTEFDGDIETWMLGFRQSFQTFYFSASYGYRVYETEKGVSVDNPEDASYESNIYGVGLLIKKMPLDPKYPSVYWRPELNLRFEQRYFQGGDDWHRGRTDNINTTNTSLKFYFGDKWNFNLDYSHIFRNVDAVNSSVVKYKEYSENRFGTSVRYQF